MMYTYYTLETTGLNITVSYSDFLTSLDFYYGALTSTVWDLNSPSIFIWLQFSKRFFSQLGTSMCVCMCVCICVCVCVCICVCVHMCTFMPLHMWRSEDNSLELHLSFYDVLGAEAQASRLVRQLFYPVSHPTGTLFYLQGLLLILLNLSNFLSSKISLRIQIWIYKVVSFLL